MFMGEGVLIQMSGKEVACVRGSYRRITRGIFKYEIISFEMAQCLRKTKKWVKSVTNTPLKLQRGFEIEHLNDAKNDVNRQPIYTNISVHEIK